MSQLIKSNVEYKKWIESVSIRFQQSQIKASVKVNEEMLFFYWTLGRDISKISEQFKYGSNFYKTVSDDLTKFCFNHKSYGMTGSGHNPFD